MTHYSFEIRPLVWLLLENVHDAKVKPLEFRALIDSGAAKTVIPFSLCKRLNHDFESGSGTSVASGIGLGTLRTFVHATRMTVLQAAGHEIPDPKKAAFPPFEIQAEFVEQNLPFVLLGQRDFLKLFRYAQDGKQGRFSLEWIDNGKQSS